MQDDAYIGSLPPRRGCDVKSLFSMSAGSDALRLGVSSEP